MTENTFILKESDVTVKVSSVLNRDNKQYGKRFLLDGNDESCWSSDQGSPQWIKLEFKEKYKINQIKIQFQGGFAGKDCYMKFDEDQIEPIYPEDINTVQRFPLNEPITSESLLLMFNTSTDFFGRIVVYQLDIVCES